MDEEKFNNSSEPEVNSVPEQQPAEQVPEQPVEQTTETDSATEPTAVSETISISETEATTSPAPAPKKSHKKLIAALVAGFLALGLIIGFVVFMIIKNQPQNIALESFSNLVNAKKVAVSGTVDINLGENAGLGPITVKIDSATSDNNQSGTLGIKVNQPESDDAIELEFGEVMMSDGVFYLKASGLKKIYDSVLSGMLSGSQPTQTYLEDDYSAYDVCDAYEDIEEYSNCLDQIDNTIQIQEDLAVTGQTAEANEYIENILQKVDNQWFKISVEEILESDLVSGYIDQATKDEILKTYRCMIDVQGNMSNYTQEFADLYGKNQFITLSPDKDSYYKVSLEAGPLTNYINAMPHTKLVSDITACSNADMTEMELEDVSASDVEKVTSNLPDIYAKFSGFFTHRLSDVKINYENSGMSVSSNLSFSYPANLNVSVPENAQSIMDVIKDIMQELTPAS